MSMRLMFYMLIILFGLVYSKANDQAISIGSDKLNISEQCQRRISFGVYECIQDRFMVREKDTRNDNDHGDLKKMIECCSRWDMVDCALENVQISCAEEFDGVRNGFLNNKESFQVKKCEKYQYDSKECHLMHSDKMVPDPNRTTLWSLKCEKVLENESGSCRSLINDNSTISNDRMVDECCHIFHAIDCLNHLVKKSCSKKDHEILNNNYEEQFNFVCPGFESKLKKCEHRSEHDKSTKDNAMTNEDSMVNILISFLLLYQYSKIK